MCRSHISVGVTCAGDGGGVALSTQALIPIPLNPDYCNSSDGVQYSNEYRKWVSGPTAIITDSLLANNTARNVGNNPGKGGGLRSLTGWGSLRLINSSVMNNSADAFGGGACLGELYSPLSSCSLSLSMNSVIEGNFAQQGANQIFSTCGGSFDLSESDIHLSSDMGSFSPAEVVHALLASVWLLHAGLLLVLDTMFLYCRSSCPMLGTSRFPNQAPCPALSHGNSWTFKEVATGPPRTRAHIPHHGILMDVNF